MKIKNNNEYSIDDAYRSLDNINSWIINSDTKASIVLGLLGVLFTIIFSNSDFINILNKLINEIFNDIMFCDIFYLIIMFFSLVLFINGIYNLILVLIPKLKLNINKRKSILYFGDICSFESVNEFKYKVYHTKKGELLDDVLNQVYINSNICTKKFNNYKVGLSRIFLGVLIFFVFYMLGILVYL